jgi:hypothetical protein
LLNVIFGPRAVAKGYHLASGVRQRVVGIDFGLRPFWLRMVICTAPEEFIAEIILFWMFAADMLLRAAGTRAGGLALLHRL